MDGLAQTIELALERRTTGEERDDHVGVCADATPKTNTIGKWSDQRRCTIGRVDQNN